ncbi:MAG: AAA family ATPase [Polyangiaceae bacterium]
MTRLELWIGEDIQSRAETREKMPLPIDVLAEFTGGTAKRILSLTDTGESEAERQHNRSGAIDKTAQAALQLLPRLPVVVVPEDRLLSGIAGRLEGQVREEIQEPCSLHEDVLAWFCDAPARLAEWQDVASSMLGASFTVRVHPTDLHVAIDSAPARAIRHLGAGVQEVASIARTLVKFDGGLLLYEEPELHLHPRIQRRLMAEVARRCLEGGWQAVVTTHSPHVLDLDGHDGTASYAVVRSHDRTRILESAEMEERRAAVEALGARPSSLLQANTVLWVEGPSDAVYLRYFLERASALRAGARHPNEYLDYTFAFFGGALLRHVSAGIAPVPQLVHLLSVHPRSFVVVDSDRTTADGSLGKEYTAHFLETACPGRVWVTEGREVENYLADEVLVWAATDTLDTAAHLTFIATVDRANGVFSQQVKKLRSLVGRERAAHDASDDNKVEFARQAVNMMRRHNEVDWLRALDLKSRLRSLLAFIDECGGATG